MGLFSSDMLEETEKDVFNSRELSVTYSDIFIGAALSRWLLRPVCACLAGGGPASFSQSCWPWGVKLNFPAATLEWAEVLKYSPCLLGCLSTGFLWTDLSVLELEMCLACTGVCKRWASRIFMWSMSLFLSGELYRASLRKQRFPAQSSVEIQEDNEVRLFPKTSCADFQGMWKYCHVITSFVDIASLT